MSLRGQLQGTTASHGRRQDAATLCLAQTVPKICNLAYTVMRYISSKATGCCNLARAVAKLYDLARIVVGSAAARERGAVALRRLGCSATSCGWWLGSTASREWL